MEFREVQKLKLWWLYILLGIETIITGSILFLDKGGITMHDLKASYFAPIWALVLPYVLVHFITNNSLTLVIDQCGLSYRYWPFTRRREISWTKITKIYLRKYDAFGEYGGWGIKYRLWFKFSDKAYIFNDNNVGLQLELSNHKKLLFSTTKADELSLFLINLKRQYNIGAIETDVRER
ncbi:hypothetical protein [Pedobacter boryungensis]|uniref:PH domain-containing protein n=1 Tax=Pedobacter boryungensis TaxID=869962 RepID=A0ABX2D949_9SPHI|nr:hypothetical protein [Pedobacter boryungensis]NQX30565.1 hypothetical protein [Pedobacter boryungensis]